MTDEQIRMLREGFPEAAGKEIYTLKEFAGGAGQHRGSRRPGRGGLRRLPRRDQVLSRAGDRDARRIVIVDVDVGARNDADGTTMHPHRDARASRRQAVLAVDACVTRISSSKSPVIGGAGRRSGIRTVSPGATFSRQRRSRRRRPDRLRRPRASAPAGRRDSGR